MTTNIKQEIQSLSFKIAMISDAKRALAAEVAVLDAELASHISKRLHLLREGSLGEDECHNSNQKIK